MPDPEVSRGSSRHRLGSSRLDGPHLDEQNRTRGNLTSVGHDTHPVIIGRSACVGPLSGPAHPQAHQASRAAAARAPPPEIASRKGGGREWTASSVVCSPGSRSRSSTPTAVPRQLTELGARLTPGWAAGYREPTLMGAVPARGATPRRGPLLALVALTQQRQPVFTLSPRVPEPGERRSRGVYQHRNRRESVDSIHVGAARQHESVHCARQCAPRSCGPGWFLRASGENAHEAVRMRHARLLKIRRTR